MKRCMHLVGHRDWQPQPLTEQERYATPPSIPPRPPFNFPPHPSILLTQVSRNRRESEKMLQFLQDPRRYLDEISSPMDITWSLLGARMRKFPT